MAWPLIPEAWPGFHRPGHLCLQWSPLVPWPSRSSNIQIRAKERRLSERNRRTFRNSVYSRWFSLVRSPKCWSFLFVRDADFSFWDIFILNILPPFYSWNLDRSGFECYFYPTPIFYLKNKKKYLEIVNYKDWKHAQGKSVISISIPGNLYVSVHTGQIAFIDRSDAYFVRLFIQIYNKKLKLRNHMIIGWKWLFIDVQLRIYTGGDRW